MKHTKGKWVVDKSISISIKSGEVYIAGIHSQDKRINTPPKRGISYPEYDTSETDANATLIASAPEMLEMLKYTLKYFQENTDMEGLEMYENLIAKAEGK